MIFVDLIPRVTVLCVTQADLFLRVIASLNTRLVLSLHDHFNVLQIVLDAGGWGPWEIGKKCSRGPTRE